MYSGLGVITVMFIQVNVCVLV